MRILVTGADGFIGRWLVPELRSAGHDVIPADLSDGDLRVLGVATRLVRDAAPDVVVHLAAQVGRVFGEDDHEHTITNNTLATLRVALACRDAGCRLLYASTSEVYGDIGSAEAYEGLGGGYGRIHNLYGLTKWMGEEIARLYMRPDDLQIVRLSMPYGPGLPSGRGRAALINFLADAAAGRPITVHIGSRRCWCWVGDTVRGIRLVLEDGEGTHPSNRAAGCWNVGRDDNEVSMREVAERACEITGASPSLITDVPAPENQTVVKRLSDRRLRQLGWEPTVDLAEGMRSTWEVVRRHGPDGMPPPNWHAIATSAAVM